jgi:hypothetical protein
MAENLFVIILDFLASMGHQKGKSRGAWFTNFETHPTSRSGTSGGQQVANGRPTCVRLSKPHGVSSFCHPNSVASNFVTPP